MLSQRKQLERGVWSASDPHFCSYFDSPAPSCDPDNSGITFLPDFARSWPLTASAARVIWRHKMRAELADVDASEKHSSGLESATALRV